MNHLMPGALLDCYIHSGNVSQKHKNNSFLTLPGLLMGFSPRSSESNSIRSSISRLNFRIFSSFSNPFRRPQSQNEGHLKRWDCSKVGLSIVDSLNDETKQSAGDMHSSDSKRFIFERQMSIRSPNFCSRASSLETPKSLPIDIAMFPNTLAKRVNIQKDSFEVVFEIGEAPSEQDSYDSFSAFSLDSGPRRSHLIKSGNSKSKLGSDNSVPENTIKPMFSESKFLGSLKSESSSEEELSSFPTSIYSGTDFVDSVQDTEVELPEDYTCVRTHGPNPKVKHFLGDRILNCPNSEAPTFSSKNENEILTPVAAGSSDDRDSYASNNFLTVCHSCMKKLDGEDIYMYRGEKAFCSYSCRSQEIGLDEENEENQQ